MTEQTAGFLTALWQSVRADILAQYRDALVTANLLLIIGLVQLVFFVLNAIHVDPDLLSILRFVHRWATVVVFSTFMILIVLRAVALLRAGAKSDSQTSTLS